MQSSKWMELAVRMQKQPPQFNQEKSPLSAVATEAADRHSALPGGSNVTDGTVVDAFRDKSRRKNIKTHPNKRKCYF